MQKKRLYLLVLFTLFISSKILAQITSDTVFIPFKDAEKIFLQNNLSLLANKYNIDINKALIRQAKL